MIGLGLGAENPEWIYDSTRVRISFIVCCYAANQHLIFQAFKLTRLSRATGSDPSPVACKSVLK
jgi:hypothetical protein